MTERLLARRSKGVPTQSAPSHCSWDHGSDEYNGGWVRPGPPLPPPSVTNQATKSGHIKKSKNPLFFAALSPYVYIGGGGACKAGHTAVHSMSFAVITHYASAGMQHQFAGWITCVRNFLAAHCWCRDRAVSPSASLLLSTGLMYI